MNNENKKELIKFIKNCLGDLNLSHDIKTLTDIIDNLVAVYNFPSAFAADLVYLKPDLINEPDFILFALYMAISNVYTLRPMPYKYFSVNEINKLSSQQYQAKHLEFPIKLKLIQVVENQMWTGFISAKELMEFRDAQIIHYNEKTQRQLRHVVDTRGETEYYTIDINQNSVDSIANLMKQHKYIPDPIVLNMPEDAVYSYNSKDNILTIKELDHFDIIDGYHRYRAMSNLFQTDPEFDYEMMIQLVQFDEAKAQQFMWQKDQQTKLKKIDVVSLNQDNAGTQVAKRLNEDSSCNMNGKILRSGGLISVSQMANAIQCIYFNGAKGVTQDIKTIISTEREIKEAINSFTEHNIEILGMEWSFFDVIWVVFLAYARGTNQSLQNFTEIKYNQIAAEFKHIELHNTMRKIDANRISNILEVVI